MAQSARHRQKKSKRHPLRIFILWVLVLAVFVGAVLFCIGSTHEDIKNRFEKLSYPTDYSEYVEAAAAEYNLEPALIFAVIRTESSFNPEAISEAGAYGIMQVMPSSFEWLQEKRGTEGQYSTEDLLDPAVCIDYGSYLLRYFYDYYGNERCAVAAYNAGFVVSDWLSDSRYSSDGETLEAIPYPETDSYVDKVESAKEMYIKLYYS